MLYLNHNILYIESDHLINSRAVNQEEAGWKLSLVAVVLSVKTRSRSGKTCFPKLTGFITMLLFIYRGCSRKIICSNCNSAHRGNYQNNNN